MAWSPREAAEYRAAADAQLLRTIATDVATRRGIYRLMGIARVAGYGEVTMAGVKLRQLAAASQEATEPNVSGKDGRRRTSPSERQRRNARAAKHRAQCAKAEAMRLRRGFQGWHRQCRRRTPQDAAGADSPPQPPSGATPPAPASAAIPSLPPVSPMRPPAPDAPSDADVRAAEKHQQVPLVRTAAAAPAAADAAPPQAVVEAQQPIGAMDDERAPKRDAPPSPAVDESPTAPRAKRTLSLPPPPPSIPPSPPSSTLPSSPPSIPSSPPSSTLQSSSPSAYSSLISTPKRETSPAPLESKLLPAPQASAGAVTREAETEPDGNRRTRRPKWVRVGEVRQCIHCGHDFEQQRRGLESRSTRCACSSDRPPEYYSGSDSCEKGRTRPLDLVRCDSCACAFHTRAAKCWQHASQWPSRQCSVGIA